MLRRRGGDATIDNVVPLALGGTNTVDNVLALCRLCNAEKARTVMDYRTAQRMRPGLYAILRPL